jgi:GTP-binding protein HflX
MKFYSQPIPEHREVPLADDGRWEEMVESWSEKERPPAPVSDDEKAVYVLSVSQDRDPLIRQAQLGEILSLVRAEGNRVVGHEISILNKPRPRTLIGKGTSRGVAARARELGASMLVLDAELTPSQMRNLEDEAGIAICDREGVILNVFLRHARSRHARIQVEIARLEYLRPRIRGVGIDMDQQMGGVTGSRGPGETASELLARQLDGRLATLRKASSKLQRAGKNRRQGREGCEQIALVGYTNAGKTSLMNALADQSFSSADQPFETLDTVSRSLSRHGGGVVISDTVGFIRRLPERLLASFESTLAEAREASLLAIVVDISDREWLEHLRITVDVIGRMGAGDLPRHFVFNKVDLLETAPPEDLLQEVTQGSPFLLVSSRDEESVVALRAGLLGAVRRDHQAVSFLVPYHASEILKGIYSRCRVLDSEPCAEGLWLRVSGSSSTICRLQKQLEAVV